LQEGTKLTFDVDWQLSDLGGEHLASTGRTCPEHLRTGSAPACAYLCFAHDTYGVAVVPKALWAVSQKAEASLWQSLGGDSRDTAANDRADEHWKAFDFLNCLPQGALLGRAIEVGAGPWTQVKGFLHIRSDLILEHLTIWEPSAERYMKEVRSCSYQSGSSLVKADGSGQHAFPVSVVSTGGELLATGKQFDTVISINVLEHVQDAFKYLTGLYKALRPGGLLVFHDRFYGNAEITQGDLYHPIRIKRKVLDHFLSGFHILFNNCSAHYEGRKDRGYYVLARKKS